MAGPEATFQRSQACLESYKDSLSEVSLHEGLSEGTRRELSLVGVRSRDELDTETKP